MYARLCFLDLQAAIDVVILYVHVVRMLSSTLIVLPVVS
jgi:hypothetical protein